MPPDRYTWCLYIDMDERKYAMLEQAKNALVASILSGSIGTGSPGVVGKGAIIALNTLGWMPSMGEESKLIIDRDVIG